MVLSLASLPFKFVGVTFLVWIFLTTVIPQTLLEYTHPQIQSKHFTSGASYPYNSITSPTPLPLSNSTVYFVIGHPDDEVMFFSPSLIELSKKKHNNTVKLVCFSTGDAVDASMGQIRSEELSQSARILGINHDDLIILDYKDGMNESWHSNDVEISLHNIISNTSNKDNVVLITFDDKGVSNHPNHISLYHGSLQYHRHQQQQTNRAQNKLYVLKSLNFWEKYSFTLLTNVELFVDHLSKFFISKLLKLNINIDISFFSNKNLGASSIKVYSDLNMLSVSYAAMAYGHFSQMVWFRYGWLILSRYLTFNQLIQVD